MRPGTLTAVCAALLTLLLLSTAPPSPLRAQTTTGLAVVVGNKNAADNLSLSDLRRLFTGYRVSRGGQSLIPFNHPPSSPIRQQFDKRVLNMSPDQMGRFWVDERIRGKRRPPRSVPSEALLIKVVANVKGAVAYLPAGRVPPSLKVLRVGGKRPGEHGYPIAP